MRVVLDTNVLIRANTKATGPARKLLLAVATGHHVLVISPFLLDETERVLKYPRVQSLWRLTPRRIQEHIDYLSAVSELVYPLSGQPIVLKEPGRRPRDPNGGRGRGGSSVHARSAFLSSRRHRLLPRARD